MASALCLRRTVTIEHVQSEDRQNVCLLKGLSDLCLLNLNINKTKHRAAAGEQGGLTLMPGVV
jgi:hypothetical protein